MKGLCKVTRDCDGLDVRFKACVWLLETVIGWILGSRLNID